MSDPTPAPTPTRTPSSVERMSNSSKSTGMGSGGRGGFGGPLTILLVVACIALIGACFYLSSRKQAAEQKIDSLMTENNDLKKSFDDATSKATIAARDVASLRADLGRSIPLGRLPQAVQAPSVNEVVNKIQQLVDAQRPIENAKPGMGSSATLTPPPNDSPSAWLEIIAHQVAKASINTKQLSGSDPSKVQLNKGIQIVLSRVGAFNKPPSGASQDTYEAVVAFQKANKLTPDGIIGKGTWGRVREKLEATAHAGQ